MQLSLPEVDRDQYRISSGLAASDFALARAREYRDTQPKT